MVIVRVWECSQCLLVLMDSAHARQAKMLELGVPQNVYHTEVAPGQHEISPIFSLTNVSSDQNQIAMQVVTRPFT